MTGTIFSNKENDLKELIRIINPYFFPGESLEQRDRFFKENFPPHYDQMVHLSDILCQIMIRRTYDVLKPGVILKPVLLTVFFQRLSYAQEKEYSNIKLKEQSTLENLDTDNILDNIDNEFRALTMGQVMNARKNCNFANLCSNESDPLLILKHSTKIQWILNFIT